MRGRAPAFARPRFRRGASGRRSMPGRMPDLGRFGRREAGTASPSGTPIRPFAWVSAIVLTRTICASSLSLSLLSRQVATAPPDQIKAKRPPFDSAHGAIGRPLSFERPRLRRRREPAPVGREGGTAWSANRPGSMRIRSHHSRKAALTEGHGARTRTSIRDDGLYPRNANTPGG